MKLAVVILSIALAICAAVGYQLYCNLENQLELERTKRESFEATTLHILDVYIQTLKAIEKRQTSFENIAELQEDLGLTLRQIRDYNARAKLERPSRKQNQAIGGSQ
jgi:hypothetical protein